MNQAKRPGIMISRNAMILAVLGVAWSSVTPATAQNYSYPYAAYPPPGAPADQTLVVTDSGVTTMSLTQYHATYSELYQRVYPGARPVLPPPPPPPAPMVTTQVPPPVVPAAAPPPPPPPAVAPAPVQSAAAPVPPAATSSYVHGWYVGAAGGIAYDISSNSFEKGIMPSGEILDLSVGWSALASAIGYAFPFDLRLELVPGYSELVVAKAGLGGTGLEVAGGTIQVFDLMVNAIYDIDLGGNWVPYVGAGLGWSWRNLSNVILLNGGKLIDDTSTSFSGQFILGLTWWIGDHWNLFAEYRSFGNFASTTFKFDDADGTTIENQFFVQRVLLGFRWFFRPT